MSREVMQRPLAPGLVTLRDYAGQVGRGLTALQAHWRGAIPGFPEPVGEVPAPGRGRADPVYRQADLDQFRAGHPERLWGRRGTRLVTGHDEGERVSLDAFAAISGIPAPGAADGCPPAGDDGLWPLRGLVAWHNSRDITAGPVLALTSLSDDELVTLGAFARMVGRDNKTVTQYRDSDPGFPAPADTTRTSRSTRDKLRYRLGCLAAWWNGRPLARGPSRRAAPAGAP
jgi:hypothetical protein